MLPPSTNRSVAGHPAQGVHNIFQFSGQDRLRQIAASRIGRHGQRDLPGDVPDLPERRKERAVGIAEHRRAVAERLRCGQKRLVAHPASADRNYGTIIRLADGRPVVAAADQSRGIGRSSD